VGLVNWFEIPVVDFERAMAFYEHVFEVELERTVIDGHLMAIFPETDESGRANGALAAGDSYVPSANGTRVYFCVDDVAGTLARASECGGTLLYPLTKVGEQGVVAEFADTEGNRIALSGPS
jgi:predicted enzyme related to lactoylglutathione lyase